MKNIAIFGSTGSVGRQALDVVAAHPESLRVSVLAAGRSIELLADQTQRFKPSLVVIGDEALAGDLKALVGPRFSGRVEAGDSALVEAAALPETDCVLTAMTGVRGLPVTLSAVRAGKRLALANKESLVAAGPLVLFEAERSGAEIIPVDSEHSALFQALKSGQEREVRELLITGSGGPFRLRPRESWDRITVAEALRHPTWKMGRKISVDSATMMNKALELVEARYLFKLPVECLRVVIHPQSIVHSMVHFQDGSLIAQMGLPDMRVPIQYALTYPERLKGPGPPFEAARFSHLTFEDPDLDLFPSLRLGFEAASKGGLHGAVLNAANEQAVELFLAGEVPFLSIFEMVEQVLSRCPQEGEIQDLQSVLDIDGWAREEVLACL